MPSRHSIPLALLACLVVFLSVVLAIPMLNLDQLAIRHEQLDLDSYGALDSEPSVFQSTQSRSYEAPSEVPPPNQILFERYFKQLEGNGLFLGSAALWKDGVLYTASTGFLDGEQTIPTNAETQYRFGSITKTLVAVLTMKAIEEKRLTLDSKLSQWLPAEKYNIKHADQITIKLLLNHRSMIMSFTSDPAFRINKYTSLQDVIDSIIKYQDTRPDPDTVPGEYCNTGFYLIGKILERIYGSPLQELMKVKFFQPFGMTRTGGIAPFRATGSGPDVSLNQVNTFLPDVGLSWKVTAPNIYSSWSSTAGAGALVSTPTDMVKFYVEIFVKKSFISAASIAEMRKYQKIQGGLNYGLGIFATNVKSHGNTVSHPGFGHNGILDGFMSQISISAQNNNKSTKGPDIDPTVSPYIIYVQSSNAFNLNLSDPIVDMNRYGTEGVLKIPQFPRQEAKFPKFSGNYICTEPKMIGRTRAADIKLKNWNEEKGDWEEIDGKQIVLKFDHDPSVLAMTDISSTAQPNMFLSAPWGLTAQFSEDGKEMVVKQHGMVFNLRREGEEVSV